MIVGDPMSAKTKAYMLLAETLTTMSERKIPEQHEFRVRGRSLILCQLLFETQNITKNAPTSISKALIYIVLVKALGRHTYDHLRDAC